MAGQSLDEAKAAYHASHAPRTDGTTTAQITSTNVATTNISTPAPNPTGITGPFYFNGVPYKWVPATSAAPPIGPSLAPNTSDTTGTFTSMNIATVDPHYDFDFVAHMAIFGEPQASINWDKDAKSIDLNQVLVEPVAYTASRVPIRTLDESPFFLDTGTNAHISLECSDFKTLRPIPPHPIAGLGGLCIFVVGIGTIDIHIAGGHKLVLENVLFAPASNIQLVSVLDMNNTGGRYILHFGPNSCWVTNSGGATILRGNVHKTCRLYYLSISKALTTHIRDKPNTTTSPSNDMPKDTAPINAFHASRVPNVKTWHCRLGHCNFGTIVNMARKHTIEGMAINLSSSPPKCDTCIRGKQTCSPVSKVREGEKAKHPLEHVFIDLCGPIRPLSSSGCLYSMNIIDDYTSYVWTIPLKTKDEAAPSLMNWYRVVENQLGHCLKILVTDNGELVSKSMANWCAEFGINY